MPSLRDFDLKAFGGIPLDTYKPVPGLKLSSTSLTAEQKKQLQYNINLMRDSIVFFTASGAARGVSGHTGGPYDVVPEAAILLSLFESEGPSKIVPTLFDEAGHRSALVYLRAALDGHLTASDLLNYRRAHHEGGPPGLPGHPELKFTPGVEFSSGRLGHMWPMANGVAFANRDKITILLGSDGSQQEGDDAEAARLAVAQDLNIKLFIDDNDVTIAGHPSEYFKGFSVAKTLEGHGLQIFHAEGEDLDSLFPAMMKTLNAKGPAALITKRKMCPGIKGLEGTTHGHDVIPLEKAYAYLEEKGYNDAVSILKNIKPDASPLKFIGSSSDKGANRSTFGEAVNGVLDKMSAKEKAEKILVIDSDLAGSTGLAAIKKKHPDVFISSGICERGNFSAAAGFGSFLPKGVYRTGVFSTFSAFLEMVISEITMARLNFSNVLCHFSHSGVDEMADNTCHFGLNNLFADNGLPDGHTTRLYFPADPQQMTACVEKTIWDEGLRFIFSTRAKVPWITKEDSDERFYGSDYKFVPEKDEFIRKGTKGAVVTFGDLTYRAVSAVDELRKEGHDIALINKSTLNVVDEDAIKQYGSLPFVIVVESLGVNTGLGSKFGSWLLQRGLTPKYAHYGVNKEGSGGLWEQIPYQGLGSEEIKTAIKKFL